MRSRCTHILSLLILTMTVLVSCYHQDARQPSPDHTPTSERQRDSLTFAETHHYSQNYNFVVKADSLTLLRQQPEELLNHMHTNHILLHKHDHIAVVDIRIIDADRTDSVWVQVARDQNTFGWIHESTLLKGAVPSDPISQFISFFSDTHLLIFLVFISVIAVSYLLYYIFKNRAKVVHFNDIDSFYPTLLAVIVASAATFYSSIQLFAPSTWTHFYFHPTLNPFAEPPILSIFLCSVWAMIIVAIAAVDDVFRRLTFGEAALYLCGLVGICAAAYIIFSITTLYYVGYVLWAAYLTYAIGTYIRHHSIRYHCGQCGAPLRQKGRCPHCGAINE